MKYGEIKVHKISLEPLPDFDFHMPTASPIGSITGEIKVILKIKLNKIIYQETVLSFDMIKNEMFIEYYPRAYYKNKKIAKKFNTYDGSVFKRIGFIAECAAQDLIQNKNFKKQKIKVLKNGIKHYNKKFSECQNTVNDLANANKKYVKIKSKYAKNLVNDAYMNFDSIKKLQNLLKVFES